jgi:hypothetical protein
VVTALKCKNKAYIRKLPSPSKQNQQTNEQTQKGCPGDTYKQLFAKEITSIGSEMNALARAG